MKYLNLMRVKHYIKNLLVFVPSFFNRSLFDGGDFRAVFLGFICFCFVSSAVYILNDIKDAEKDRNHPKKKNRPIASGQISRKQAAVLVAGCLTIPAVISLAGINRKGIVFLAVYFLLNVAYSMGLKNYPIVDVVILASGFVIRILYGGMLTDIAISGWLYLVMVAGSLFMGLGKRRNELKQKKDTREVLKYYNEPFVDKNMYVTMGCVIVFYALWTLESASPAMIWTVPAFMVILMKYSYDIESDSDGDPVEVVLDDRVLMILSAAYAVIVFGLLYIV